MRFLRSTAGGDSFFDRQSQQATVIPYCDTPGQSVAAAIVGGVVGTALALAAGLDLAASVVLAGLLGGIADLTAHVVRGDDQFRAAIAQLRG